MAENTSELSQNFSSVLRGSSFKSPGQVMSNVSKSISQAPKNASNPFNPQTFMAKFSANSTAPRALATPQASPIAKTKYDVSANIQPVNPVLDPTTIGWRTLPTSTGEFKTQEGSRFKLQEQDLGPSSVSGNLSGEKFYKDGVEIPTALPTSQSFDEQTSRTIASEEAWNKPWATPGNTSVRLKGGELSDYGRYLANEASTAHMDEQLDPKTLRTLYDYAKNKGFDKNAFDFLTNMSRGQLKMTEAKETILPALGKAISNNDWGDAIALGLITPRGEQGSYFGINIQAGERNMVTPDIHDEWGREIFVQGDDGIIRLKYGANEPEGLRAMQEALAKKQFIETKALPKYAQMVAENESKFNVDDNGDLTYNPLHKANTPQSMKEASINLQKRVNELLGITGKPKWAGDIIRS